MSCTQQAETPCVTLSGLMGALKIFKATFDEFAGIEGDPKTLTKGEVAKMLRNECCCTEAEELEDVKAFFSMIAEDSDGIVDFKGFTNVAAALIMMCGFDDEEEGSEPTQQTQKPCSTKPSLRLALAKVKEVFDKYAGLDGDPKTLTRGEVAEMLRKECCCTGETHEHEVDAFFSRLNLDGDHVVDFCEFSVFAAEFIMSCEVCDEQAKTLGLLQEMAMIKQTFNKYAGIEGDPKTLTKREVSEMLLNDFNCKQEEVQDEIDTFFFMFDQDCDGVVDFEEFTCFAATLVLLCGLVNTQEGCGETTQQAETPGGLQQAMAKVKCIFDKYAGKEGDPKTLTKREVSEILHNEFPDTGTTNQNVETFFNKLDVDGDDIVDFPEFAASTSKLMLICDRCDEQECSSETTSCTQQTETPADSCCETMQQAQTPCDKMSDVTLAVEILRNVFKKYAGREGDPNTLNKRELADLLRNELPCCVAENQTEVNNFFCMLDGDRDGAVDFTEFATFIAGYAVICSGRGKDCASQQEQS